MVLRWIFSGYKEVSEKSNLDFGVYVVNLFDTFHASHLLQTEKHSLSHLLEIYCNVKADKRFQLSDWRRRPLTEAMIRYAQSDTHYLLYIFDVMRNQLLDFTSAEFPNAMKEVLIRSQQTSLIQYTKPIYDAENGKGKGGWLSIIQKCAEPLNEENIAVLRAIHGWRDHIARQEDESTHYILPKHMLLNLAKIMPITARDLLMQCNPTPAFIKLYSVELAKLIEDALESTRAGQKNVEKKNVTNVVKDKSDQFNIRISIEKREIKHKMDISSSKTSQLFGNINVNSETQNFNGRVTLKIASFPDVEEHVPEQLVDNEETTPIKTSLLDKLATPYSNTSSPKRHLEFEEPQESKKKAKPIPENFKPFSYSDKNVEMGETEKKFFDPMSDYQKHNSKVLDSINVENKLEK
jgi:ribonuclease D